MAALPTTNLTWTGPESNTFSLRRLTDWVHGTTFYRLEFCLKFSSYLKRYRIFLKTSRLVMHTRGIRHFLAKDHNFIVVCLWGARCDRKLSNKTTNMVINKTYNIRFEMARMWTLINVSWKRYLQGEVMVTLLRVCQRKSPSAAGSP
jgi:hypothetical protein